MLVGVVASAVLLGGLARVLRQRTGWPWALAVSGLAWSLVCLALVTLLPAYGAPGVVPADSRSATCSFDYGGPAPDGFWVLGGGQRLLNVLVFVPSGALVVLVAARVRRWWPALVVLGVALLAAYSVGIELTQLALARLDRACDVTDMVDNASGAALGALAGLALLPAALPALRRSAARPPLS